MPTDHILSLLIEERDKLTRAIEALQGSARRPGRPRKNPSGVSLSTSTDGSTPRRGGMSVAARKAASARMKLFWAKRRKAAKSSKKS